jgi:hypothetical protein
MQDVPSRAAEFMALFSAVETARPAFRPLFEDRLQRGFCHPRFEDSPRFPGSQAFTTFSQKSSIADRRAPGHGELLELGSVEGKALCKEKRQNEGVRDAWLPTHGDDTKLEVEQNEQRRLEQSDSANPRCFTGFAEEYNTYQPSPPAVKGCFHDLADRLTSAI